MIKYLAMIAAWVGDKDLACQQLAIAVRPPSTVSYGQLKLLPFWDPLRGDHCFEKIVGSLAPKWSIPTDRDLSWGLLAGCSFEAATQVFHFFFRFLNLELG
jgi:hypothetical protein